MITQAKQGQLIDMQLLEDLLETMELGSLCALGGGVPLPVKNTLKYFKDELTPFIAQAQSGGSQHG